AIHIHGAGNGLCAVPGTILTRTTDYGHTMYVGGNLGVIDFAIEDIGFLHVINYSPGPPPTMENRITVNWMSAHLYIVGTQYARVERCALHNMPNNLVIDGGSRFSIRHNDFRGLWDPKYLNCQQSRSNIFLTIAYGEIPTNIEILDNSIAGYLSVPRARTINNMTITTVENV